MHQAVSTKTIKLLALLRPLRLFCSGGSLAAADKAQLQSTAANLQLKAKGAAQAQRSFGDHPKAKALLEELRLLRRRDSRAKGPRSRARAVRAAGSA